MADEIKNLEKQNKLLTETIKLQEKIKKGWAATHLESRKTLTDIDKQLDDTLDSLEDMHGAIKKLHMKGALKTTDAEKLKKELDKLETQIIKISTIEGPLNEKKLQEQQKELGILHKGIEKIELGIKKAEAANKSFIDLMAESGPSFMKSWAGFRKAQKEGKTGIDGYAIALGKASDKLSILPGGLKLVGSTAKGLSSILGGVSKIFASWPGAIMMGIVAMGKIIVAADQIVKDANKSFALVRGPDIMTKDIKKQFEDFNRQIYSTADNIRTGLNVTQIRSLMEAMTQAGLNITRLNEGLLKYRDAIYISAKASRALGMDITWVGAKIGEMITDFRMNMETIDKTFVQIAFDAKKSGISTDRFWGAIQNATSSLALYGVFLGAASKTVKRFTEDMVGGAKDAEEATGDMFGIFKTGSLEGQAAVLDFAKNAGADISGMFKKMSTEFKGKALNIKARIENLEAQKQTEQVRDQLQKLRSEYSDYQSKNMRYSKMIGRNSVVQASEMAALAGDAPEILLSAIRGIAQVGDLTQVSGERMLVAIKAGNEMGVSEKTIRMLVEQAKMTKEKITMLIQDSDKYFTESLLQANDSGKMIAAKIKETVSAEGQDQIKKSNELIDLMTKSLGMPPDQAKMFTEMAIADKTRGKEMADLIATGDKQSIKSLFGIMNSQGILNDFQAFKFKQDEKAQEELAKNADENLKNIVKETLSLKEMADIAKDEIKFRLSSLGALKSISSAAGNILGWLLKQKPIMTESQKAAQGMIKTGISQNGYLKDLLKEDKDGNITAASQQILTGEVVKKIGELDNTISTQEKVKAVLEEAGAAEATKGTGGGLQVIKDAITNIETALDKTVGTKKGDEAYLSTDQEKALADQLMALEDMQKKIRAGQPEKQYKKIAKLAESNDKVLEENKQEKEKLKKIQEDLVILNKTNQTIADFTEAQILADPKAMAVIGEQIASEYGKGGTSFMDVATKIQEKYGSNMTRALATTQRRP